MAANKLKEMNEDINELIELCLFSLIPTILIWITSMSITFLFTDEISYTIGFWVYGILSALLGVIITSAILSKARK